MLNGIDIHNLSKAEIRSGHGLLRTGALDGSHAVMLKHSKQVILTETVKTFNAQG
jgi:hypothetical protein